jgi:hypothetical protein
MNPARADTAGVPRYKIAVTAQLDAPVALDAGRLSAVTGGTAKVLAPDVVRVVLTRRGRDAECAADRAMIDVNRALAPSARFARPPAWQARQLGPLGLRRRTAGRWRIDGGDDGLGGVREPRRPFPPTGSATVALDPPG